MNAQLAIKNYNNGIQCAKEKKWDEAIEFLNKAIIEDPEYVLSYSILGRAYMEMDNIDAARKCWHMALRLEPGNVTAKQLLEAAGEEPFFSRIEALLRSVPFRELLWPAIAAVLFIALIASNSVSLYYIRRLRAGLAKPAAEWNIQQEPPVEQTQTIESTRSEADERIEKIYNQGLEACQLGLYDQAIEKFQQVLAYPPPHELKDNAQYWLSECYYAQGNFAQATIEFQKVKQYFPEAGKVFDAELKIAYTYYNLERLESAKHKLLQLSKEWPRGQHQSQIAALLEKIKSRESE